MALIIPKAFWPLTITTAVNDKLDVRRTSDSADFVAVVPPGTYFTRGAFLAAVQSALNAAWSNSFVVTADIAAIGKVQISGAAAFQLRFGTGPNVAIDCAEILGYTATDKASATTVVAENQHQNGWYADDPVQDDTGDLPYFSRGGRSQTVSLDGKVASFNFSTRSKRTIVLSYLAAHKTFIADEAAASALNQAIERLVISGWARLRWHPDRTTEAGSDYAIDISRLQEMPRNRYSPGLARYTLALPLLFFG